MRSESLAEEAIVVDRDTLDDPQIQAVADRLASNMSRRTLTRRFREETGVAPMAWLTDARLDRARELLETTAEAVEKIGRITGLGAPASVRVAFHRRVGTSPREFRSLFRHRATSG